MSLDITNGLPIIYIIFGTSDTNESTFGTHVGSYAGTNVGRLKPLQRIITTNPDTVESYIQFDGENNSDPIQLN